MTPLVSVIIPLYNAENFIEETIRSALAQTHKNLEIVIINDGSTDRSLTVAKKHESNIVKIYSQKNKGASAARNFGLTLAKGVYIQFLDADDLISPDKIEKQISKLNGDRASVTYCDTAFFLDKKQSDPYIPLSYDNEFISISNPTDFFVNLWGGNNGKVHMVTIHAWLFPTDLIKKFGNWDEELSLDDDGEFVARVAINACKILYTPLCLAYYRKYTNSKSLSALKSEKAYYSQLRANRSKCLQLFTKTNSRSAKNAIYLLYTDLSMKTYIHYPHIYVETSRALRNLRSDFSPVYGGHPLIKSISFAFGWKTAKRIEVFLKRFHYLIK
jgi:glycosyltransferase involved in cell wall biosynthesis